MKFFRGDVVAERHDINAFAILRNAEVFAIQNLLKGSIAYLFKRIFNDIERAALVMNGKSFNVFAKITFGCFFSQMRATSKKRVPRDIPL